MDHISAFTIIQIIGGIVVTFGFPVVGWFIHKIFDELEQRRQNERELYKAAADQRVLLCEKVCEARELALREILEIYKRDK